jgi:cytochrome c-type biogenesis protein CcmF
MAVCPMLSWAKTDGPAFWKKARIPGICALVLFALLVAYFFVELKPSYDATIAAGGAQAATMLEAGPAFYYFILTLVGFLAASLLFMNSLFMLGRIIGAQAKAKGTNPFVAFALALRNQSSRFGGFLAHLSMAIILVGLIGSSMYVSTASDYIPFDEESDTASKEFVIDDYRLVYVANEIAPQDNGTDVIYTVTFDVYHGDDYRGQVSPGIHFVESTQQRKPLAAVLGSPMEDLFVVYNGISNDGDLSISAFINPCISFVWVGFALLMVGTAVAALGRRGPKKKAKAEVGVEAKPKAEADAKQKVDAVEAAAVAKPKADVKPKAKAKPKADAKAKADSGAGDER